MSTLAINGGTPVFETAAQVPAWPPADEGTAEELKNIYLSHAWSFYGKHEVAFNNEFAAYTKAAVCAMMANGTVTLEVAMQALGIGPGDEVIVPAYTWIATGSAVVVCGATPVIVDIEPDTLCMDPEKIEEAITPRTRAIIPVHLYGSMADLEKIMAIAAKHNLYVIEDCAHAQGGHWQGKHVGTIGVAGSFSFQQSKTLSSGEGGACITNDPALGEAMGRISHIGYQYGAVQGKSTPPPVGMISHNYRITEFQAVILRSQLKQLQEMTELRAKNAEVLRKRLEAIPGIRVQAPGRCASLQSYYQYAFMIDPASLKEGITTKEFCEAVRAEGVTGCGAWGWGALMFRHNLWSIPENLYRVASFETAENIVKNELCTLNHTWLMLDDKETAKVAEVFEKVMAEYTAG